MAKRPVPKHAKKKEPDLAKILRLPVVITDKKGQPHLVAQDKPAAAHRLVTPADRAAKKQKRSEVVRRQRLLRSAGFDIVPDGIWGPRSQTAWREFKAGRKASPIAFGPLKTEPQTPQAQRKLPTDRAAIIAQQEKKQKAEERRRHQAQAAAQKKAAAKAAQKQRAIQRQQVLDRARRIHKDPASSARLTLRQLSEVLVDRETKLTPDTKTGAVAVQTWLNAHGRKVPTTGVYDRPTHDALQSAFKQAEQKEMLARVASIRDELYEPLSLQAGAHPTWWPYQTPVPKPAELDRIIQAGGFQAASVLNPLLARLYPHSFDAQRQNNIAFFAKKVAPFALQLGQPTPANLIQAIGTNWNPQVKANMRALSKATSAKDYANKLTAYIALEEQKYINEQQRKAAESIPWWGKAVEKILAPGEFLRTAVVYDTMRLQQLLDTGLGVDGGTRDLTWEDAKVVLGGEPLPDYDGQAEAVDGLLDFGFDLVADPLIFARPFRASSSFLRWSTKGSQLGAYSLKGGTELFPTLGKQLVYNKGTWSKVALVDQGVAALGVRGVEREWERAKELGRTVARTREEAIASARKRVTHMTRHAFVKPTEPNAAKAWKHTSTPRNAPEVEATRQAMNTALRDSPEMQPLIEAMLNDRASLYTASDRSSPLSNVGASLLANLAEKARVVGIHQTAQTAAEDRFNSIVASWSDEARAVMDGDYAKYLSPEDRASILKEYSDVVDKAGVYIVGGTGDPELAARLMHNVGARMDDIEFVLIPRLQDILEEEAEIAFNLAKKAASESAEAVPVPAHPLWDEHGKWVNARGEAAETLRAFGRESFEDEATIPFRNPAFGVGHTTAQAMDAIESEVRRRLPRMQGYVARGLASDTLDPGEFFLDREMERVRSEVQRSWKKRSDGLYYDTRETIETSALYQRHLLDAYKTITERVLKMADAQDVDVLAELSMPPFVAHRSAMDDGLWKLSWNMGSRFRRNELLDHPTRRSFTPQAPDFARGKERSDFITQEIQRGAAFNEALAAHKIALDQAADSVLPRELAKEKLVWMAMAKSQARHWRLLYNTLYGSMRVWTFITLPLRPGWVIRNVIDNVSKAIIQGVRDPRYFFLGASNPGSALRSVFNLELDKVVAMARFLDGMFGTRAADALQKIIDQLWELPTDVLSRIFKAHAIDVPEAVLDGARMKITENARKVAGTKPFRVTKRDLETAGRDDLLNPHSELHDRVVEKFTKTTDAIWDMMGSRPENYWKRVIYRSEYAKAEKELRASGAFLQTLDTGRLVPIKVEINWSELDKLGKTLPKSIRDKVQMYFTDMSYREYVTSPYLGQADVLEYGSRWGLKIADNGRLDIHLPYEGHIATAEDADRAARFIANIIYHEHRHAVQATSAAERALFRADDLLPYRYRLKEIDARGYAWRKTRRDQKIVTVLDESGQEFPTRHDEVAIALAAHERAWDAVTETLFDYSKITVTEDNLRVFFPFIQFWRKNTAFWTTAFASKPWLTNSVLQFDHERQEAHRDLPQWMRRYISTDEIVDAAAVVPGLAEVVDAMLPDDAQFDPMSFASFAPLYRAYRDSFYGDNANLPEDRPGLKIIGPMLDAMNDWGLSMNPIIRKPMENAGIASERSWQYMFPQTPVAVALTRQFFGDDAALKVASWESAFDRLPLGVSSDAIAENFDFYVRQEIAGQVARGEDPDRAKAEATIRLWFITQNAYGYFAGTYFRRATPEDIYISKLTDDVRTGEVSFNDLSDKEKELLKLWSMRRGVSREQYDRYLTTLPLIQAFYGLADFSEREEFKEAHPEIVEYVQPGSYKMKPVTGRWLRNARRYTETERFFQALDIIDHVDPPYAVRQAATDMFVSAELLKWWDANDTPADVKTKMVKAEAFRYYHDLNAAYFKIPVTDYDAKNGFLDQHPELVRYWGRNNNPSEDYSAILSSANAHLRERYFDIIGSYADKNKGFDAAAGFLKRYPFMFEDTKSASKVDETTGEWKMDPHKAGWSAARIELFKKAKPHLNWFFDVYMKRVGEQKAWEWLEASNEPGMLLVKQYLDKYAKHKLKPGWTAERIHAFLEAKSAMTWFFKEYMPTVGKTKAWEWLETSDSPGAQLIKDYLAKYGKHSQKQIDYLRAQKWLQLYFDMAPAARGRWLSGGSEGAKIVLDFFQKYADPHGMTQHGKDFLAIKPILLRWKAMNKAQRRAWFEKGSPDSVKLLDYFKKYGKKHQYERAFTKGRLSKMEGGTPEQRSRIAFWEQYFALDPDKRPSFILRHGEQHGIFIWGDLGEQYAFDAEADFLRRALGAGASEKQAHYLYVKPLLDFYFELDDEASRKLFLRANPELDEYFAKWTKRETSGDASLDRLIEEYFQLPPDSAARSAFLSRHSNVQDWFDRGASPADRAMRAVLEQYFALGGAARSAFAQQHPEIGEYFDRRRDERHAMEDVYASFDQADPRYAPFFENAADLERAAELMRDKLKRSAIERVSADSSESRRDRRPS